MAPDYSTLSDLLQRSVASLDISPGQYQIAVSRYEHLGAWLVVNGLGTPEVYPQGSFRLGTVVRPDPDCEFDIDLVFWRGIKKTSVTQGDLKDQAGSLLTRYLDECGADQGSPKLEERGRCWCLVYDEDGFHMDVLPVIPDDELGGSAILLTDRDLREWQHSNPIGYADWFWKRMEETVETSRSDLATFLSKSVEEVPLWLVRTPLQRAVQVIKRHRDLYFADHPEDQPTSILLTTLAGQTYGGQVDVYEAVAHIANSLDRGVERRPDGLWVPNPAHPLENFADKWRTAPERRGYFEEWHAALVSDVGGWIATRGLDQVAASISKSLGGRPVREAAAGLGRSMQGAVAAGAVGVTTTGEVARRASTTIPNHNFHGGSHPR